MKMNLKKAKKKNCGCRKFGYIYTKNYQCFFLFAWLIPIVALYQKWENWSYKRMEWNTKTAEKVLTYYLENHSEWEPENDSYCFNLSWIPEYKWAPIGYRSWAQKFNYELMAYLEKTYRPENCTKEIVFDSDYNTWVIFKENA